VLVIRKHNLKVREHSILGPYVDGLSTLAVSSFEVRCSRLVVCKLMLCDVLSFLSEIVEKDCQSCKLNKEDAIDRKRWRMQIRDD